MFDNCSAYGQVYILPELLNVYVLFLPKNTTARLQPMDAGILVGVKCRYRQFQVRRALNLIERGITNNIYDLDVRDAATTIYGIWERMEPQVIKSVGTKQVLAKVPVSNSLEMSSYKVFPSSSSHVSAVIFFENGFFCFQSRRARFFDILQFVAPFSW